MTDREFDQLLKKSFDLYAKETLAQIPDIPDFSQGDPGKDESYARLMARIGRGGRPAAAPAKTARGEAAASLGTRQSAERKIRRRGRALALLSAACLALLCLSVFLAAKMAGRRQDAPAAFSEGTLPTDSSGSPDPAGSAASPALTDPLAGSRFPGDFPSSDTAGKYPGVSDADANAPETSADSTEEQIFPEYFHSSNVQSGAGESGDFADPKLVVSELPRLIPENTELNRRFVRRTGGSIVFWSGEVEVLLSYDRPVLPAAVIYTFDNPDLLPQNCVLMGRAGSEWVEIQSYTCKISRSGVSVAFYLDTRMQDESPVRYTEFCLSYSYTAMPDENYQVPDAALYGFSGEPTAFSFARYSVSGGVLYSLSTNLRKLTLPQTFAGVPLRAIHRGAISGILAPDLTRLTIPEGVETLEIASFLGCGALERISLPGSFELPVSIGNDRSESAELYAEEIEKGVDLDGSGTIGAPLSALFEDCPSLSAVDVDPSHPTLISQNGQVFLRDGSARIFPGSTDSTAG